MCTIDSKSALVQVMVWLWTAADEGLDHSLQIDITIRACITKYIYIDQWN